MLNIQNELDKRVFYVMCDQPNCCPYCQSRTEIMQTIDYEKEKIQVNFCSKCEKTYLFVDE